MARNVVDSLEVGSNTDDGQAVTVPPEFERAVRARLDNHTRLGRPEAEVFAAGQASDDPGRPLRAALGKPELSRPAT
ncbi:hypothetical protein AB0F91_32510 [Amycolatopsis sp. NPDC023774]|uniref:hypothetical protein n=1 Tax=Amycolatopsis sp. NPDC023774 TaxID=3155015 RepID=UPI0033E1BC1B